MMGAASISLDVHSPTACPYFTWDAPVTNGEIRSALSEGTEEQKLHWTSRILREAKYDDIWTYLSLRKDVLPRFEQLRGRLGRRAAMLEFLVAQWRRAGLV